jgi:hypothetical protein
MNDISEIVFEICSALEAACSSLFCNNICGVSFKTHPDTIIYSVKELLDHLNKVYSDQESTKSREYRCILSVLRLILTKSCTLESRHSIFCLLLMSKLVKNAQKYQVSVTGLLKSYKAALSLIHKDSLGSVLRSVVWSSQCDVEHIVRSKLLEHQQLRTMTFTGKLTASNNIFHMSCLVDSVVQVFLAAMHETPATAAEPFCVVYHTTSGASATDLRSCPDTLYLDIPLPRELTSTIEKYAQMHKGSSQPPPPLVVALFECSLELSDFQSTGQSISIASSASSSARNDSSSNSSSSVPVEYALLSSFVAALQLCHVTLVACQKRVHPYLLRLLSRAGIRCIPRVSVRFIGALQRLSGARLLGSIPMAGMAGIAGMDVAKIDLGLQQAPVPALLEASLSVPVSPSAAPIVPTVLAVPTLDAGSLGILRSVTWQQGRGKNPPAIILRGIAIDNDSTDEGNTAHTLVRQKQQLITALSSLPGEFVLPLVEAVLLRHRTCCTVLISAPTDSLAKVCQVAHADAVKYLKELSAGVGGSSASLLYGSGLWQDAAAAHIRRWIEREKQQFRSAAVPAEQQNDKQPAIIPQSITTATATTTTATGMGTGVSRSPLQGLVAATATPQHSMQPSQLAPPPPQHDASSQATTSIPRTGRRRREFYKGMEGFACCLSECAWASGGPSPSSNNINNNNNNNNNNLTGAEFEEVEKEEDKMMRCPLTFLGNQGISYEALLPNLKALEVATEVAGMLLNVDQILFSTNN